MLRWSFPLVALELRAVTLAVGSRIQGNSTKFPELSTSSISKSLTSATLALALPSLSCQYTIIFTCFVPWGMFIWCVLIEPWEILSVRYWLFSSILTALSAFTSPHPFLKSGPGFPISSAEFNSIFFIIDDLGFWPLLSSLYAWYNWAIIPAIPGHDIEVPVLVP